MDGPDSVEKANYLPPWKVAAMAHSERDKRRKFAKTLKESLEEDPDKKKRHEDELVIEHFETDNEQSEDNTDNQKQSSQEEPTESAKSDADSDGEHIDLKA